ISAATAAIKTGMRFIAIPPRHCLRYKLLRYKRLAAALVAVIGELQGLVNMDFTLSPEIEDLRQRTRAFIEQNVLPLEADPQNFSEHENIPLARIAPVQENARKAGLWAPQSPKQFGGMALPIVAWAAVYEEAARSLFGPLSINCSAPDDGNMNLL